MSAETAGLGKLGAAFAGAERMVTPNIGAMTSNTVAAGEEWLARERRRLEQVRRELRGAPQKRQGPGAAQTVRATKSFHQWRSDREQ